MMHLSLLCCRVVLVLGVAASFAAASPQKAAAPKPPSNDDCLACHSDAGAVRADGRPVAVKPEAFAESIHGMGGWRAWTVTRTWRRLPSFPTPRS